MISYPGSGMVPETTGWNFFIWFVVWLCMFKGVGMTGRVIYFTMALPLIMIVILAIRSLSLPNASEGYRLYVGVWRTESLQGPQVCKCNVSTVTFQAFNPIPRRGFLRQRLQSEKLSPESWSTQLFT